MGASSKERQWAPRMAHPKSTTLRIDMTKGNTMAEEDEDSGAEVHTRRSVQKQRHVSQALEIRGMFFQQRSKGLTQFPVR